jgi:hypothetical protein
VVSYRASGVENTQPHPTVNSPVVPY